MPNLYAAWNAVRRKRGEAGLDGITLQTFAGDVDTHVQHLHEAILAHAYEPTALRRIIRTKRDGRQRHIGIPTVADRVVQHAILQRLEPCFEPTFAACSYDFRPGRSAHQAVMMVLHSLTTGSTWVVEADLADFFDTLDWTILHQDLTAGVPDPHVLDLVHRFLRAGALRGWHGQLDAQGTPQDVVFSPLFSNVYLTPFDRLMTTQGYRLVRYEDDFVTLHRTHEEATTALQVMRTMLEGQLHLRLHPTKTVITDARRHGFAFLSFWFHAATVVPTRQSVERFRNQVQQRLTVGRQEGGELAVVEQLNPLIRGWGEHFKIGQVAELYGQLDAWLAAQLHELHIPPTSLASLRAIYERHWARQGAPSTP
jgi:group II intron reverse transcriptase/maturase